MTAEQQPATSIPNDPATSSLNNKKNNLTTYGDWQGHLNRVEGSYSARIHAAWSTLDGKARQRGFAYASAGEKRKAAFAEVESFVTDAVAWCQHEQDRGTSVTSPFTEQREAEVIAAVRRILDGIVTLLTEAKPTDEARRSVQKVCDVHKVHCEQNLIRPRFHDGRADFREPVKTSPQAPLSDNANKNEEINRAEILDSLQPAVRKAYFANAFAESKAGRRLEDREAYDFLNDEGLPDDAGNLAAR